VSEPLNSAQIALADGIAERVAAALREDQAASPLQMFKAELMRGLAKAVVDNPPLKVLIDRATIGHNGGPPIDDETSGAMTIPEFCTWARISRSTLYQLWEQRLGPKFFKAGVATRITRRAAKEWLIAREAAAAAETESVPAA
jgi:hypothetical protein